MNQNSMAVSLIQQRGNRTAASLLSWLEENVYEYLDPELQSQTRTVVLDNLNDFKNLSMDICKSDNSYINEVWLEAITEIKDELKALRRAGANTFND